MSEEFLPVFDIAQPRVTSVFVVIESLSSEAWSLSLSPTRGFQEIIGMRKRQQHSDSSIPYGQADSTDMFVGQPELAEGDETTLERFIKPEDFH